MLNLIEWNTNQYYDDANTERFLNVTFNNGGNQIGIELYILHTTTDITAKTLTIKLQEYTGGAWVTRTTNNFLGTNANFPGRNGLVYFPLDSWPVTNAASTWRYSIKFDTASIMYLVRDTVAANYLSLVALDADTSLPSSGDTIAIASGKTLTNNANFTYSPTNYIALAMGQGSSFLWDSSASYTMTLNGQILCADEMTFQAASEASPVLLVNKGKIDISNMAGAHNDGTFVMKSGADLNAMVGVTPKTRGMVISIWGAPDPYLYSRVAATANTGQKIVTTRDDMSAIWQVGDQIELYGSTTGDYTAYTIASMSGTSITLNTNITQKCWIGGAVVNVTRGKTKLGFEIDGGSGYKRFCNTPANYMPFAYVECGGIYANRTQLPTFYAMSSTAKASTYKNIFCLFGSQYYFLWFDSSLYSVGSALKCWLNLDTIILHATALNNGTQGIVYPNKSGAGTLNNIITSNPQFGCLYVRATNFTMNGVVLSGIGQNNTYPCMDFQGTKFTSNDCFIAPFIGTNLDVTVGDFTNFRFVATGNDLGLYIVKAVDMTFANSALGSDSSGLYVFSIASGTLARITNTNCTIGANGINGLTSAADTSYIKFDTYNQTANDHRVYWKYGMTQSTGDSLTDTTVHTSGTGKFAIRFAPSSSTSNLDWSFTVPTGNIQNKTMTVTVWVKINSTTFYAGTHQKPRLTVNYDNGTLAYAEALGNANWQLLAVNFTPTTTYGQITVTVSGRTDATSTNAYFYVDDFGVAYPPNVALDLGGLDNWASGLPVVPPLSLPISAGTVAQSVWQQLTTTSWGTGSLGESVKTIPGKIKVIDGGELPIY